MKKRTVINSPRLNELKKRRKRVFIRKVLILLVLMIIATSLLIYFSRNSIFKISSVEVTGNKVVETEKIKTTVEEALEGTYLWLVPKTNILFYPSSDIKNKLTDDFKRLQDIDLSVNNKKVLEVSLSERTGVYTWCGLGVPEKINANNEKCYFLDKDGFIFDEAPYFSGEVYFKFYGPTEVKDGVPLPAYFVQDNFQKMILFKNSLEKIGVKPVALHLSKDGDVEIFLSRGAKQPTGPKIILKMEADYQKAIENLEAAINTEPLQSNFKNKFNSLQYIDLRFGNKVYYKFNDETKAKEVLE